MKRDPRLRPLSEDHHHALVVARRVERAGAEGRVDAALVNEIAAWFARDLEAHFTVEEQHLVPALRAAGHDDLATRLKAEHQAMRGDLDAAIAGDAARLASFGAALREHVRFEERELFPACEADLPAGVLDEVERRARPPKEA